MAVVGRMASGSSREYKTPNTLVVTTYLIKEVKCKMHGNERSNNKCPSLHEWQIINKLLDIIAGIL